MLGIGAEAVNDQERLEQFVIDNPELEQLEDLLAKFNIFDVLKLQRQEIRHSNFLAWLFDPSGSHRYSGITAKL